MNSFSAEKKGTAYVITSGLCYGLLGYFGLKIMKENFSAYNMLFWRFSTAALVIFIFSISQFRMENFLQMRKIFILSAIFHGSAASLYFIASTHIGSGLAMVLFFAYPVVVLILNQIFYRTKFFRSDFFAVILILIGIILIADIAHFNGNFTGIIIGISAAICFGLYVFSVQKSSVPPLPLAFVVTLGCAFSSAIFAAIDGSFQMPNNFPLVLNIFAMGIICTALPILFFLRGLKYIRTEKAAIVAVSEPLAVLFFGFILLGEKITLTQFCGAVVILCAALIAVKNKKTAQDSISEMM